MAEDTVADLTKIDDDTGLKIPLRRYYLFVTTFSLSHYLQSLSFKFSHTHHPIIGAKPYTKSNDQQHEVIDLTTMTGHWRNILLFDDGFGGLAFGKEFVFD